jgi:hypothetical protein
MFFPILRAIENLLKIKIAPIAQIQYISAIMPDMPGFLSAKETFPFCVAHR